MSSSLMPSAPVCSSASSTGVSRRRYGSGLSGSAAAAIAEKALPDKPAPYQRLDTAVLEALILKGALGMSEDDISHFNGLDYARSTEQAREQVSSGAAESSPRTSR